MVIIKIQSGIYCISNLINDKKYIGQSIHISERWKKHISELNNNKHHNDYLQKSWNKYGQDSFEFLVLEYCTEDMLNQREQYYIEKYNTLDRNFGYNLKTGGQLNCVYSDETRKKMSESIKQTFLEPERREIQKKNALLQWSNPEIKEKITGKNNGMYGKKHTQETKEKISKHNKGMISSRRNRTPVYCIELNKIFDDATEAGKELSIDGSAILKVCQGKRHTCGGYHWEFTKLENNIS